jgi:hypothetical protein
MLIFGDRDIQCSQSGMASEEKTVAAIGKDGVGG